MSVATNAIKAEALAIGTPTAVPTPVAVKVVPTITPLAPIKISKTEINIFFLSSDLYFFLVYSLSILSDLRIFS